MSVKRSPHITVKPQRLIRTCVIVLVYKKITNNVADQSRTKSLRRTASHSIVTF